MANEKKEFLYAWEGIDKKNKAVSGEMKAESESVVKISLRSKGISVNKIKKQTFKKGKKIEEADIAMFTRQLATMMKAGVPLLQSFDIVAGGHENPSVAKLLIAVKEDIETGSSLVQAFQKHPQYFDELFCNLVAAGEQGGILEGMLDRLAVYKEKTLAIKSKIKSALMYPISVIVVALVVVAVIMIWVVPAFKKVFAGFGAELPAPTQIVINMSDWVVANWYMLGFIIFGSLQGFKFAKQKSKKFRNWLDARMLTMPIFGSIFRKATIARWARTLSTMFAAGVPLVEALDAVAGAAGNNVYYEATKKMQTEITMGGALTVAMQNAKVFPNMVLQMASIGEESGALESMLGKVADFYEQEVDDAVEGISSLMEPFIISFLGVVVGGLVVAMYMPIFNMGKAV